MIRIGFKIESIIVSRIRRFSSIPEFTKDRYSSAKRGDYATLNKSHVQFFTELLGPSKVLTDPSEVIPYNIDWIKSVRGSSNCVLKPKTTEQISKILSFCNNERLSVCPQGGNTSLVGGSVPVFDEVIISTSLMNSIIDFDDLSGVLVCEAGCVLEQLENFTKLKGFIMPIDLGAKGSCQIGGNVSTNAGGLKLLRYGNLHGSVLGLEVVKANGDVIDCMSTLKKDNTGYHLNHLFIGSEGTLGIVTKVAIQCPISPNAINLAFLGMKSFDNVIEVYKSARKNLAEILSSCEMMDFKSLNAVVQNLHVNSPLNEFPFYMIIETAGSCPKHDEEKIESFVSNLIESSTICDGIVTNDSAKMMHIWQLRERVAEGLLKVGYVYKYDITLPLKNFYEIVEITQVKLKNHSDVLTVAGYGHVGDGNLHLNISAPKFSSDIMETIQPIVYEFTSSNNGSISAEHGIGFLKKPYLSYSKSDTSINLMKELKQLMDPKGILNPYKVI